MAYVKKARKRSGMRKYRRRFNITRKAYIRKNSKVGHLTTKRFVYGGDLSGSDTVPSLGGSKYFALNDLPSSGEFTSLFDQYMITGISYRWVIIRDPIKVNTSTYQGIYPRVMWVHDHDSVQTPTAFSDLQQYPRCQEVYFTSDRMKTRWYYLKCAVAQQFYNGVTTSGYGAKWRQWLDSGYPGTQHYGLRWFYSELYAGEILRLECKYHLKFKSVI